MKAVILAGGRGTRLSEETSLRPKPMIEIGGRPLMWHPGDNPKTAVHEYLRNHPEFEVDRRVEDKLLVTVAPGGFLRRIR